MTILVGWNNFLFRLCIINILITGGCGFIGSALIRLLSKETDCSILNIDKLSYAANHNAVEPFVNKDKYKFIKKDICSLDLLQIFEDFKPQIVMNLAAESHVDRSIESPGAFIQSNIIGTYNLLETSRSYYKNATDLIKNKFRFIHISTDEVFGSLGDSGFFEESTAYDPSSPYSASKASSDHLVRAWHRTYGLPAIITNCSNNYGPYQFPEKIIPLMINNAINHEPLTIYGDGLQIRDWLYVDDHVKALYLIATNGSIGETYNIGGRNEKTNIDVVNSICKILDKTLPSKQIRTYSELITYVQDRPGHDRRYAINANKIQNMLGWSPAETFETGIAKTINWYLNNSVKLAKR
tara:strand:- start:10149 stop:11207 length:1059 start_codon:yes stop_codon:yes gene_type:complete